MYRCNCPSKVKLNLPTRKKHNNMLMIIEPKRKAIFGTENQKRDPALEMFVSGVSFSSLRYCIAQNIADHAEFCFTIKKGTFNVDTIEQFAGPWEFVVLEIDEEGNAVCCGMLDDDVFQINFIEDESYPHRENNIRLLDK